MYSQFEKGRPGRNIPLHISMLVPFTADKDDVLFTSEIISVIPLAMEVSILFIVHSIDPGIMDSQLVFFSYLCYPHSSVLFFSLYIANKNLIVRFLQDCFIYNHCNGKF